MPKRLRRRRSATVCLTKCEFGGITASEIPARVGLNMSRKLRRRVCTRSRFRLANSFDLLALAERAEHGADPDHRVGRRRQAHFVAVLDRQDQRRAAQRLGFGDAHADQRALGRHRQLEDLAGDAVGLGEVGFGATRRDVRAFLVGRQQAAREQSRSTPGRSAAAPVPTGAIANSENGSIVCAPGGRLRFALAIRSLSRINGEFEIIVIFVPARMQNAIGSSSRRQRHAGARADAAGDRQEQRRQRLALHDRRKRCRPSR